MSSCHAFTDRQQSEARSGAENSRGGDFCEKLDRSLEEAREKVAMGARRPCGCALRCKSEGTVCGQTRWATGDVAN